jgi:hypothetical protein
MEGLRPLEALGGGSLVGRWQNMQKISPKLGSPGAMLRYFTVAAQQNLRACRQRVESSDNQLVDARPVSTMLAF